MSGRGDRPWVLHLRVFPGGDGGVASALLLSGFIYGAVLLFSLVFGLAALGMRGGRPRGEEVLALLGLSNALPCSLLALLVAWRLHKTKPLAADELGVDPVAHRVWQGSEAFRIPKQALSLPLGQRRWSGTLRDGRAVTCAYRLEPAGPDEVLALGRVLQSEERELGPWVEEVFANRCADLLPDPAGVREVLQDTLLPKGVLLTWMEVDGVRV